MRHQRWLLIAIMVVIAACSSDGDSSTAEEVAVDEPTAVMAPPSASFCSNANRFVTSSAARLITTPDAEVFVEIDRALADLSVDAPGAVSDDVQVLREGFGEISEAYESTGFDPTALLQLPQETLLANGNAVRKLEAYLVERCDLDEVRDAQIADITEAFGVQDEALAECLHTQLGDVANIDSSSLTPELMITEVCGTSILGLLSGDGETDS